MIEALAVALLVAAYLLGRYHGRRAHQRARARHPSAGTIRRHRAQARAHAGAGHG